MKKKWLSLVEEIQNLLNDNAEVISGLRECKEKKKIEKNFMKNVSSLSRSIEEFNAFIPDDEVPEIKMPFESAEFAEAWDDYKEFLLGVFEIVLIPVEEKRRLKRIYRLADREEKAALEIIDFLMSSRYKSVFKPNEFQRTGESPTNEEKTEEQTFTTKKNTL